MTQIKVNEIKFQIDKIYIVGYRWSQFFPSPAIISSEVPMTAMVQRRGNRTISSIPKQTFEFTLMKE